MRRLTTCPARMNQGAVGPTSITSAVPSERLGVDREGVVSAAGRAARRCGELRFRSTRNYQYLLRIHSSQSIALISQQRSVLDDPCAPTSAICRGR